MKSRFQNWFGRGGSSVERELAASRPEPPETLVRAISAKIQHRPARSRARVGIALGLSAAMLAAIGASGGLGYASSSLRDATSSITKLVHATSVAKSASAPKAAVHNAACGQYAALPTFTSMTPTSAYVGQSLTFKGHHFAGDSALTAITFHGGKLGTGTHLLSDSTATTHVPFGATTGVITLTNCKGSVNTGTFTLTYHLPVITSDTSPRSGPYKTQVTIRGSHFYGATAVKFNGVPGLSVVVQSDKQILAKVPFGAGKGPITVTNPAGTSNGLTFTTTYIKPSITSFTPTSGKVGASVTITGKNFNGTTAVKFNGKVGTGLNVVSDTSIKVKVPTGATTGTIAVTNLAGTGTSTGKFTVTK